MSVPSQPLSKSTFIEELALGTEVCEVFLLASASQSQARNGPYWRLEFRDRTGSINGKIWSPQSLAFSELSPGCMVRVTGRVSTFRDSLELTIDSMQVLEAEACACMNLADFIPCSLRTPDEMLEELHEQAHAVLKHKPWRKLFALILADRQIEQGLRVFPAAKSMHHAYSGGLLEHTLSVIRLTLALAERYPALDRQVLFMGAFCHDLGKIWELTAGMTVEYTQAGKLLGHIPIVLDKISPLAEKAGVEPELAEHLKHLLLSHHGLREYGSPTLPATAEAFILHFADNIDAKMQQVEKALAGIPEGETGWSSYISSLERAVFRAKPTPGESPAEKNRGPGSSPIVQSLPLVSQCSLLSKE